MKALVLLWTMATALAANPDPKELVRQSISNGERAWKLSRTYESDQRDVVTSLDAKGNTKRVSVDVYHMIPIGGAVHSELVSHGDRPLTPEEKGKEQEKLRAAQSENRPARARREAKEEQERVYMREVPDAFDFRIVGEENLPSGRAWVLEATPHPGYQPKSRYAKVFSKMQGKLWIDKKDVQWVKADAVATNTVSFGFLIARLGRGSHIVLEQMRLPDGNWTPKSLKAKASARIMLVSNRRFEEDIAYSNYRKTGTHTASR